MSKLTETLDVIEKFKISTNQSLNNLLCCECDNKHHEQASFCRKCGACLYVNSVQDLKTVRETGLPFHTCTKCNTSNFWD